MTVTIINFFEKIDIVGDHREWFRQNSGTANEFRSLFKEGRSLSFPCDAEGRVAMDALSERALANYLYARSVVGRDYALPFVDMARER